MENKTPKDPLEVMAELCEDDSLKERVLSEQAQTRLIDELVRRRVMRGLSQADLARAAGLTPSKVCRIEKSLDAELRLKDIVTYCKGLEVNFGLMLDDPKMTCAEKLRHHVEQIDEQLRKIQDMAEVSDDSGIIQGIYAFQANVLFKLFKQSSSHVDRICRHIDMVFGADRKKIESSTGPESVSEASAPACACV